MVLSSHQAGNALRDPAPQASVMSRDVPVLVRIPHGVTIDSQRSRVTIRLRCHHRVKPLFP
jgi:hypothetical protein